MKLVTFIKVFIISILLSIIGGVAFFGYIFSLYKGELPTVETLKIYTPPMVTRIHAGDGQVIAERATNNRFFFKN